MALTWGNVTSTLPLTISLNDPYFKEILNHPPKLVLNQTTWHYGGSGDTLVSFRVIDSEGDNLTFSTNCSFLDIGQDQTIKMRDEFYGE